MRRAKVTLMHADLSTAEVGEVDCDSAVAAFQSRPWEDQLARARSLDEQGRECVDPDITFTVENLHLTASAKATERFFVEVCVPRRRRLFGLIRGVTFYSFGPVGPEDVSQAIRSFMTETYDAQHTFYSQLARVAA